jgi:CRP-like cAMP-binding protein
LSAAGNYVGEIALVSNSPRSATVSAASYATQTIRIDGAALRTLMDKVPVLARDVEAIFREPLSRNERVVHSRDAGNVLEFLLRQSVGDSTDVLGLKRDAGPSSASLHVPTSCRHCEHPYCMTARPMRYVARSVVR